MGEANEREAYQKQDFPCFTAPAATGVIRELLLAHAIEDAVATTLTKIRYHRL